MTDPTEAWTPDDDIAMIKVGSWPCSFALAMKKPPQVPRSGDYEFGCITPMEKTAILKTDLWDFDPFAKKIEYDSVEALVKDGWMVD